MNLPGITNRTTIVGRTGTGKTVAGVWHLSNGFFTEIPYVVYDFKRDVLLAKVAQLDGAEEIDTTFVPSKPGIYLVHPHPDDREAVEAQLLKIWERGNTGIFVDEGLMIGGSPNKRSNFRLILTQGRSLHIPVITLSQRPAWLDRFVFSESEFFQVFDLSTDDDQRRMMQNIRADISEPLPEYHSYWYDVKAKKTVVLKPVPTDGDVLSTIARRLDTLKDRSRRVFV